MRYRLRTLLGLITASAVVCALLRASGGGSEPYWGLYLIGLTSISAGIAAMFLGLCDPTR